jgi:hypothetical protein
MKKTKDQTAVQAGRHPFRDVRNAGCPLVAYETSDPAQTIINLRRAMNGTEETTPIAQWDTLRGLTGVNDAGATLCKDWQCDPLNTGECGTALDFLFSRALEAKARETFAKGVFFFHNAHRFIDDPRVMQGVWNLRDIFEKLGATLVMLNTASKVPIELRNDVVTISDPLPTLPEISKLTFDIAKDAVKGGFNLDPEAIREDALIADTLTGISGFGVRQTFALSLRKDGVDQDTLWDRKRKLIEQTAGLSVWKGGETFDELGGLKNLKDFLTRILTSGTTPIRGVLHCDEIEKSLAGASGDTSGTSQDQLGVILRCMEDWQLPGIILVGPPGVGKSAISKAAGSVANAPVVALDLGAMKGSLVGESEGRIRAAMDVFQAVCQGRGIVIATCNKIASLPPELRRRFSLGTFFVDLPQDEERKAIWKLWRRRYEIPSEMAEPPCDGWSGAECKACCDIASRAGLTLVEAAKFIVPVCKSAADQIKALRDMASGRFISANKPGVYDYSDGKAELLSSRTMKFD